MSKNNTKSKLYIVVLSQLTPELTLIINFSGFHGRHRTLPTSSFVPSEMPSNEINIYLMHHIDLCDTSELMLHIVA